MIQTLLHALWQQDFQKFSDPKLVYATYLLVFIILFLENGILPAAFLPGDSLLILIGVLIAKGILTFPITLLLLTIAVSLGSWLSYLQGTWLENNSVVNSWLANLPPNYHIRAHRMFHRHGLSALLFGRFIAFIRTLLPTIAGLSGLSNSRFQFFNWMSAFFWVLILTVLGFFNWKKNNYFKYYEEEIMLCLMLLPLTLLTIGLISYGAIKLREKFSVRSK
ncbi:DedA family protein [Candidatus Palibaumannia cicadellinicola]|uniref:DedA family inner membrane protein YqjA n=1 Tax=Candidatus Palibaumannia cicadellinicola TaxID=186490 RepID=A0A0K2BKT8_9GAMM|nr:DedA family protein [Candidatus Baumannia cicadellinicola]AKZ65653.1 DedA family inner membrane protein YqjA [Candidatus Baumannia cicadellinicola]